MAAGQGFKTFATGDVLTAADTNGYLMQGIWVFANATARDAAVTSPQEGNACYLKDTDAVQTYSGSAWVSVGGGLSSPLTTKGDVWGYSTTNARVPVGTNGQVLTADSTQATGVAWATAASGGWTSIASGSLSGSTLSLTSISGSYKNLKLVIRNAQLSNSTEPGIQLNGDTGTNYSRVCMIQNNTTGLVTAQAATTQIYTTYNTPKLNTIGTWIFDFEDYANTTSYKTVMAKAFYISGDTGNPVENAHTQGSWKSTSAITQIDFKTTVTFNAGTYILYGGN